jgi:hypothetical protein
MSASIEVRGMDDVRSLIASLGDEMERVNAGAQNQMAYELYRAEQDQMRADIDRPTPWSVGSLRYKKYDQPGGEGAPNVKGAAVHFAVPFGLSAGLEADEYLGVQSLGGKTAGPKRSEVRLRALGYLPADMVWVPAAGVKLDRYGNVSGATIQSMLADLAKGPKGANFFVLGYPRRPRGIFARIGEDWHPFLWFISRRSYTAIFDFYGRADREVEARFKVIWGERVDQALRRL